MPFDFNLYSGLLLPPFLQAMIFAILFWIRGKREARLSDQLMGWLLLLNGAKIAFWMLGFAGWYDSHDQYSSFMFYFPFDNLLFAGPLLYFYFLSLTNTGFRFQKQHWPHAILPAALVLLVIVKCLVDYLFYYPFPVLEETQYGTKGPYADLTRTTPVLILGYLSFFYYLRKTALAYKRYQEYLPGQFSFTEGISFRWIRHMLIAISAGTLIFLFFELLQLIRGTGNSYKLEWYGYIGLGILVYLISLAGYTSGTRRTYPLQFEPEENIIVLEEEKATEKPLVDESLRDRLLHFMDTEHPYLDPELSLAKLARQTGSHASALSKLINDGTGRNFNDFVNHYRVQEVIRRLKAGEQETQTLLGIALDCGFNSKPTFNRAFKKSTGISPREWQEQHLNS